MTIAVAKSDCCLVDVAIPVIVVAVRKEEVTRIGHVMCTERSTALGNYDTLLVN